ncbi:MAG: bifunctional adenosylcobinamide kinase/adenosylcobinamide-phosphate guanylyltransferase [Ignavibacteriaceae bacterium]
MIYFITGGARSGKSSYAQKLALQLSDKPVYIATSRVWDDDHKKRIERHIRDRDRRFILMEEEKFISRLILKNKTAVIDCITLWLVNFFSDNKSDADKTLKQAKAELNKIIKKDNTFIIVSNEIGMGIHADTETGRRFTDLQGWINQYIASKADKVFLMVSGIPLQVK